MKQDIDAWTMPGRASHLAFPGDVMGDHFAPVTLALTHPRFLLSAQTEERMNAASGQFAVRMAARTVVAALLLAMMLQLLALSIGAFTTSNGRVRPARIA